MPGINITLRFINPALILSLTCILSFASCDSGGETLRPEAGIARVISSKTPAKSLSDREIMLLFIASGMGEGDGNLVKMLALPRNRLVKVIQRVRDRDLGDLKHEYSEWRIEAFRIKAAHLLCELDVNCVENKRIVIDAASDPEDELKTDTYAYLGRLIEKGDKHLLPIVFDAAPKSDASWTMSIVGIFSTELTNSPKDFLRYLAKEPIKVREKVYELAGFLHEPLGIPQGEFDQILNNLRALRKCKNVGETANEFLRYLTTKQDNST